MASGLETDPRHHAAGPGLTRAERRAQAAAEVDALHALVGTRRVVRDGRTVRDYQIPTAPPEPVRPARRTGTPPTRVRMLHDNAGRRRIYRLRRTVVVAIAVLLLGTLVARVGQDPVVALPRDGFAAQTALSYPMANGSSPGSGSDDVLEVRAIGQPAPLGPAPSLGEAEEGADEPTAAPGATLTEVPDSATGTLSPVPIPATPARAEGRLVRFAVEVEDGVAVDGAEFAAIVAATLTDERGWQDLDHVRFVPVSPDQLAAGAPVDLRVVLATTRLTAKLCAPLRTYDAKVSCFSSGRAVLNLYRWVRGANTYGADLSGYRTYLVNHEIGHSLGHRHVQCPRTGAPAPVMVQQTLSLGGCSASPWPSR